MRCTREPGGDHHPVPVDGATRGATWIALATSGGTMVCCALPALLVSIGAGAALAGLVSAVPQIVWLSEHKALVFTIAVGALALAGAMQWRARRLPCPADPRLAAACSRARRFSLGVYALAVGFTALGAFFAFVAPRLA
jgi:hypothetical protein